MRTENIEAALAEAKRFIVRVEALKARRKKGDPYGLRGCKESGAVRRASLDLTVTLAEMRKP